MLEADESNPLDYRLKNVKITARESGADFPIFDAKRCKYIEFDNVTVEGFLDPYVISDNRENVKIKGSTKIKIK